MEPFVQKIEIAISYQKELTNKGCEALNEAIEKIVPTCDNLFVEIEDKQNLVISANELQDAIEVFRSCKEISDKKGLEYVVLMMVESEFVLDKDIESDDFTGRYIRLPEGGEDVAGLALRFIYNKSTKPILILMENIDDHKIRIRATDLLDKTYDFEKSYNYLNLSIQKIANF